MYAHCVEDSTGRHYTGRMLIHGVINDPETTFSPELLQRFGTHGSMMVVAKGYFFFLQRFGGGPGDNRTAWFYGFDHADGEDTIFAKIGIQKPSSRKSGILSDDLTLNKIKAWVKRDMGDHFDPEYHQIVDCLDRITVRGDYGHGESTLRDNVSVPIVCIGDSLLNCGLGGGGILAMQDAVELSKLMNTEGAFDKLGRANLEPLRNAEIVMMKRKAEHSQKKNSEIRKKFATRDGEDPNPSLSHFVNNPFLRVLARMALRTVAGVFKSWYWWDQVWGQAGSGPSSPVYPNVKALL